MELLRLTPGGAKPEDETRGGGEGTAGREVRDDDIIALLEKEGTRLGAMFERFSNDFRAIFERFFSNLTDLRRTLVGF